jgi:two-component system invasion response regulator UvrY
MNTSVRNRISLLLVEENETILDSLRNWITMMFPDVRLIEATSHNVGIFLCRAESPDIVLMDISGLGRGGIKAVRSMKTANPSALILTLVALEHDSYRQAVLKAGASGCACIWKIRSELLPQLEENLGSQWVPESV